MQVQGDIAPRINSHTGHYPASTREPSPARAQSEHLLAGAGPSSTATRLQQLAAIAEGAEHVADATLRQLGRRRQEPGHEGLPHGLGQLVHK